MVRIYGTRSREGREGLSTFEGSEDLLFQRDSLSAVRIGRLEARLHFRDENQLELPRIELRALRAFA